MVFVTKNFKLINSFGDITQSSFGGVFLIPLGEINIQIKVQQGKK